MHVSWITKYVMRRRLFESRGESLVIRDESSNEITENPRDFPFILQN